MLTDIPFDYFEKQLSAKYGPPTFRKLPDTTSDQQFHQLVWNLRFTTITLDQLKSVNPSEWGANMFSVFMSLPERPTYPKSVWMTDGAEMEYILHRLTSAGPLYQQAGVREVCSAT